MNNPRQPERRIYFTHVFRQMPLWEVWETEQPKLTTVEYFNACRDAGAILEREMKTRRDFRPIPRRLRRSMARVRARWEWRATPR